MRKNRIYLYLSAEEQRVIAQSLVRLKNSLVRQGRYTDCVDDLRQKLIAAGVPEEEIAYIHNALAALEENEKKAQAALTDTRTQLANAQTELETPFAKEEELTEKTARLKELNILLNMDQKDNVLIDDAPEEDAPEAPRARAYER